MDEEPKPGTSRSKRKKKPNSFIYGEDMVFGDDMVSPVNHEKRSRKKLVPPQLGDDNVTIPITVEKSPPKAEVNQSNDQSVPNLTEDDDDFGFDLDPDNENPEIESENNDNIVQNDNNVESQVSEPSGMAPSSLQEDSQETPPPKICTGFSEIQWNNLNLRQEQVKNAISLVESGHIFNVIEKRISDERSEITANCIRQASVMDRAFSLSLQIDNERTIIPGSVTCVPCPFGACGDCKHALALMLYVNTERDETKTDQECAWLDPSKAGKKRYPRGQELEIIAKVPEKFRCPEVSFESPSDEIKKMQADSMEKHGNIESPLYKLCKKRRAKPAPVIKKNTLPEWVRKKVFRNIGVPNRSCRPQNQKDQVYYEEKVALKSDKSFHLCFLTIPQRLCTLWYDERDKRFTGTTVRNCSYLRF